MSTRVPVPALPQGKHGAAFEEVRGYILFGLAVVATLLGGVGVWAASANLAGAVIAVGNVAVDTSVKKVQHPTGGVVGAIHVSEGQHVEAGDVLLRLDETVTRASLQMVSKQLDEVAVRQARLVSEQNGYRDVAFPAEIQSRRREGGLAAITDSEVALFNSRRDAREGLKAQLRERIAQLRDEISGLTGQRDSRRKQLQFARDELSGLETLEGKRLVSSARITGARRTVAELEGDIAQVAAEQAQASGRMSEIELQILQLDQDLKAEVGKDLRDQQGRAAELAERKVAAEDQLRRVEVRAPQSGTVHQLSVHTVGGVIAASEQLMLIVPDADRLVIDARVAPQDIDQVHVGQRAHVRFSAFNQRTTPDMTASVIRVSADLVLDAGREDAAHSQDMPHYSVRLALTDDALRKLGTLKLIPGMPAEVHISTEERTALSYFTKPLSDQFSRAFRER